MPPNPAQPNPPAFTIPPSTPLPPMHPYNKLNQSTPASSTSTPETKDTNGNSSTGGSGLRPSYARPTPGPDARPNTFPYNSPGFKAATDNATPGSASSQGPSSHTHAGPHHHHLHHSHSRPTQTPPSAEPSPGNNGATASLPRARAMGPTTEPWNADRPMRVMNTRPPEYNTEAQREREGPWSRVVRPDEAQARRAREERERALNEASKATQANPYPRPSLPPSPSTAPASANGAASRTSTSPTITNRPNLPLPGVQALGSRSLPSPFERERQSTGNDKPAGHNTGHNRSLSGSSNRDTLPSLSTIQSSPGKTNPTTQPGSRSLYGGPPPLSTGIGRNPSEPAPSPLASPNTSSKAPTPSSATMPTSQSAGSTPRTQPGYGRYHGAFMGLGPFGYQGPGTSYEAITNREREKQKEMLAARQAERERLAVKERADQKEKDKARQAAEARTAKPMTEYPRPLWRGGQPWYPPEEENTTNAARIEVLNAPAKPAPAAPVDSVIQQVAPSREPRPYTYAARNESAATQAALGKEREYQYTPRDKRPRMDAAVEDQAHRRGSVSKSRRKKEETGSSDKMRSPTTSQFQTHAPTRDFSQYTKEIRVWPEVISSPVEIWLKSLDDLNRTVATVQYRGSEWTLAQTQTTTRQHEGGIVTVQITGSFFGAGEFIVRGENGWDEGSVGPLAESEITRGQESRRIWGTDVYTDDSDLGLALVHAGWIRWSKEAVDSGVVRPGIDSKLGIKDSQAKRGVDVVEVTVRVVPKLLRYIATERNGVRTRSWGNGHDGGSIVIEGVKRVKVDNVMMKIARNRKIRMAEMTCQRSAVLNYPSILGEIEGSVNAVDEIPTSMFISARGPGLRYNPDDLKSWIQPSEEAVTANTENQPKDKLQDHDLVLQNATDVYSVKKSTPAAGPGTIVITVQQLKPFVKPAKEDAIVIDQDDESFICKERVSSKVHFVPQGLIIEDDESTGEARLIPVDFYSWTPRVKVE